MPVEVRNNDIEKAIRKLRKKMHREGISQEMRKREAFEKPSERRKRERKETRRRADRRARLIAIEEGLLPKPTQEARDGQEPRPPAIHHPTYQRPPSAPAIPSRWQR